MGHIGLDDLILGNTLQREVPQKTVAKRVREMTGRGWRQRSKAVVMNR
jgi:hypothetical protein